MSDMTADKQAALRVPFEEKHIGTMHGEVQYVSHAFVTDRLLTVDPEWSWEPMAYDADGLPKFDDQGGLWIRLTVCGITRIGYGEPQGKNAWDKRKGAIGNAIRVAAMRFGVALDLWAKETPLPPDEVEAAPAPTKRPARPVDVKRWVKAAQDATDTDALNALAHEVAGYATTDEQLAEAKAAGQAARARLAEVTS